MNNLPLYKEINSNSEVSAADNFNSELLPTGKNYISYSEINDWLECSYRHKLKYIDKINLDKPNIYTEYGKIIHSYLEEFILNKKYSDLEQIKTNFRNLLNKLTEQHQIIYSEKDIESFSETLIPILEEVPKFLDKEFPGWIGYSSEMSLLEAIDGQNNKLFKGFIDTVIKVPIKKKKRKNIDEQEQEYEYYILDWKTTNFGWLPDKKRDFYKHLQLVLYKYFFHRHSNVPLKHIKCAFVLLKRIPRKSDNSRVELVKVSVGPKTQEKAFKIINDMINQVQAKRFLKNRDSCRYCVYSGTKYCF